MRETRLFLDVPLEIGDTVKLPDTIARHAVRVLRLMDGDRVVAFNGDGNQYPARLLAADPRHPSVRIESVQAPQRESPLRITLVQALARAEKMDWVIQKATELGVAAIVPITSERSEVRLGAARAEKRLGHWRAVALAACAQSGRNVIPHVAAPASLQDWLATGSRAVANAKWVLYPGASRRMRELAALPRDVTLAAGPEGGFGDNDLAAFREAGYGTLALGPRVLRTETAGMVALAALQAMYGDA